MNIEVEEEKMLHVGGKERCLGEGKEQYDGGETVVKAGISEVLQENAIR